jgi:hypothetical protein
VRYWCHRWYRACLCYGTCLAGPMLRSAPDSISAADRSGLRALEEYGCGKRRSTLVDSDPIAIVSECSTTSYTLTHEEKCMANCRSVLKTTIHSCGGPHWACMRRCQNASLSPYGPTTIGQLSRPRLGSAYNNRQPSSSSMFLYQMESPDLPMNSRIIQSYRCELITD